jgi:2'-5' RNA ligase
MRAFIAVDLGSEEVRSRIREIQRALMNSGADLKPVEPENLHFTLQFLGEISELEAERISEALGGIEASPFSISFRGVGYFPGRHRISVVWVGVDAGREEFVGLAEQVEESLRPLNFRMDKRFVPHLTICRVKTGRNRDRLISAADGYRDADLGSDTVSTIRLKESHLTPKGPIYSDRWTKTLG